MRLFQRTLLSFAGVIVVEAGLASFAIAAVVGTMQTKDAAREIGDEAQGAFESFNSWKLAFWKRINELAEDEELHDAIVDATSSPADDRRVIADLRERLSMAGAGAGAALLVDGQRGLSRLLVFDPAEQKIPENWRFAVRKTHPYIEIISAPDGFWFSGTLRLAPDSPRPLDLFLLKHIDPRLIGQLSWDPMITEALTDGYRVVQGGTPSTTRHDEALLAASMDHFLGWLGRRDTGEAWLSVPRLTGPAGPYSAFVQLTGSASSETGERPLSLIVVLSLAEYGRRAESVNEAVLAASLLAALVTIILALALSRSIASPIRRLAGAMGKIGEGDYRIAVAGPMTGEIGELLSGFHSMGRRLEADRLELDAYIREIVGLKDYREAIFDAIREGLAVVAEDGRVESANRSFLELFGLKPDEATGLELGARLGGLFDEGALRDIAAVARGSAGVSASARRLPDGRCFELKLYPLHREGTGEGRGEGEGEGRGEGACILVVEETTDRLAYEERVIRAEKLGSIGMLSAGIAHEINNPLSSILSNVQNLIEEGPSDDEKEVLRLVERETLRIARTVRQLLAFSASSPGEWGADAATAYCSPNEVARELLRLVGRPYLRDARIHIALEEDPDCPEAAISEDELKQVLLNLLKNALHAVGEEGFVLVRTRRLPEGLLVEVADSGGGIPDQVLGRIFDPFFTSRRGKGEGPGLGNRATGLGSGAAGLGSGATNLGSGAPDLGDRAAGLGDEGTGLGLSVVWGIVTARGGSVSAANDPAAAGGKPGAVFRVILGAAKEER